MSKIVEIKFGSHLYGTNTPSSDLDFKAIYLPEAKDIVLGKYKKTIVKSRPKAECERNNKDDIDMETFSLDRFLELLCEGQTVALDILFAPTEMYSSYTPEGIAIMKHIYDNRHLLLTKNINAFVGYAKQQAAKYGIKGSRIDALKRTMVVLDFLYNSGHAYAKLNGFMSAFTRLVKECEELVSLEKTALIEICMLKGPTGIVGQAHLHINGRFIPFHATVKWAREIVGKMLEGYGKRAHKAHLAGFVDYKALSHAVRVNSEAIELLNTVHITFPRPDRELLLKIKLGELPYDQVAEMIEQGLADLYTAQEHSILRDEPDYEFVNNLVYSIYSDIVKKA
jgi:predicted nucleotidyltransferase